MIEYGSEENGDGSEDEHLECLECSAELDLPNEIDYGDWEESDWPKAALKNLRKKR
jgi:hypothetical protein